MKNPVKSRVKSLLVSITILVMIIAVTVIGYRKLDASADENYNESIRAINELEWQFILSVLTENTQKATIQADYISANIEKDLLSNYSDIEVLKNILETRQYDTEFFEIMDRNIRGVYLNVNNDNNDLWIGMNHGIISDLSLNCASDTYERSWDKEMTKHYNKVLCKEAINAIVSHSDRLIFWEFLRPDQNQHNTILTMNIEQLHKIYRAEGVQGLKTYEFLCPSYITPDGDIFGTPDVTTSGVKQSNYKIIVVQGFNIHDQLMSSHKSTLTSFDMQRQNIKSLYKKDKEVRDLIIFMFIVGLMTVVILLMSAYNGLFTCLTEDTKREW